MWLVAGFIAGLTSFGGNLIAVPPNTLVMEPKSAILAGCISGTAVFFGLTVFYRKFIIWKETLLLVCGAMAGMPFGIIFLKFSGARAILLAASLALTSFLVWQFFSARLGKTSIAISPLYAIPFGLVSGVMMAAVGMGGPPLVLFAYLRQWSKNCTLGSVNAASLAFMLFVLPAQFLNGLFSPYIIKLGLWGMLSAFIGIYLSIPIVKKIDIQFFRKLLLFMICISAIVLFWRAL